MATAMGMGMGRQRSQSAREKVRPYPHPPPQPQPQLHQQQDGRPGFKTVYPDVGVRGNVQWISGGRGVVVREREYILNFIRTRTLTHTHTLIDCITAIGMEYRCASNDFSPGLMCIQQLCW
jgi:hypothetical protein